MGPVPRSVTALLSPSLAIAAPGAPLTARSRAKELLSCSVQIFSEQESLGQLAGRSHFEVWRQTRRTWVCKLFPGPGHDRSVVLGSAHVCSRNRWACPCRAHVGAVCMHPPGRGSAPCLTAGCRHL